MYDKSKIEMFHKAAIEEYNRSLEIEKICSVKVTSKTDGTFTQIGIRPLVDGEMFISPGFDPRLSGAGRLIAIGERDFLIKTILDKKDIEKIEFKEDIKDFPKYIYAFNDAVILLSTKFYVEVFTKLMRRIDYEEKYPRLDGRYQIIPVPEKILGDHIIIIDKNAILWEKKQFDNEITKNKELLDINIKPKGEKVDITIRSLNKIAYIEPKLIKILRVKNEKQ